MSSQSGPLLCKGIFKKMARYSTLRRIHGICFVAPAVIILLTMMVYPVVQVVIFSVCDVELPTFKVTLSYFRNYREVMSRYEFPLVIKNTFIWVVGTVLFRFLLALWAAVALNTTLRGVRVFQIVTLIPWTIPQVVAAYTWRWIFQSEFGLLNSVLMRLHLYGLTRIWLGTSGTAIWAVLVASIWKGFPFVMIVLLAGMKAIPKEQFESAKVDGATALQAFRFITLPWIKGVIAIILVLETIWAWNTFDLIYVMTGGGPGGATEVLGLFVYRIGFREYNWGQASALGIMLLIFSGFLLLIRNVYMRQRTRTLS